jgi:hypothetical protein
VKAGIVVSTVCRRAESRMGSMDRKVWGRLDEISTSRNHTTLGKRKHRIATSYVILLYHE